jgi:hypothetical protein
MSPAVTAAPAATVSAERARFTDSTSPAMSLPIGYRHADSLRVRVLRLFEDCYLLTGYGLTCAEATCRYEQKYGLPNGSAPDVAGTARYLWRVTGELRREALTPQHIWYAPTSHAGPIIPEGHPYLVTARYVEEMWARLGRPVATAEVSAALAAAGVRAAGEAWTFRVLDALTKVPYVERGGWQPRRRSPDAAVVDVTLRGNVAAAEGESRMSAATARLRRIPNPSGAGRHHALWLPGSVQADATDQALLPNRSDAVREVVRQATAQMGIPATRTHVRWWIEAHQHEPAARSVRLAAGDPEGDDASRDGAVRRQRARSSTHRVLTDAVRRDAQRAGRRSHVEAAPDTLLLQVDGPLTAHGARPPRYSVTSSTGAGVPIGVEACRLEDVADAFRSADELAGIALLRRSAGDPLFFGPDAHRPGAPLHARFAQAREGALTWAVMRYYVGGEGAWTAVHADRLTRHVAQLQQAWGAQRRWIFDAPSTHAIRWARGRVIDRLEANVQALVHFLNEDVVYEHMKPGFEPTPWCIAGGAGLVGVPDLAHVTEAASTILGAAGTWRNILLPVRRFPALPDDPSDAADANRPRKRRLPSAQARSGFANRPEPRRIDRVDAVLALYDAVPLPRAHALLAGARRLLGHVLRDVTFVGTQLASVIHEGADPAERRALVLALGLLGELAPLEAAAPGRSDPADAAAYALAAVIAHLGHREPVTAAFEAAEAWFEAAADGPAEAALDLLDVARRRVDAGAVLSVIG